MHHRCKSLVKEHPALQYEYDGSDLEQSYLFFTRDDRLAEIEFRKSYESMRAWRFGKG